MVQATYDLRAKQQTSLTPRLQQSVKLLQMSALEFTQEVQQALSTNPFLEEGDDEDVDAARDQDDARAQTDQAAEFESRESSEKPASDDAAGDGENDLRAADDTQLSSHDDYDDGSDSQYEQSDSYSEGDSYSGDYPVSRQNGSDGESDIGQWARSSMGLHDRLRLDLSSYRLEPRDAMLAQFIIEALDDDGYLRTPFDELADPADFDIAVQDSEWNTALKLVQQLHVPGLGARTLQECLTLQLKAMDASIPGQPLALTLIADELARLAKHDYVGIERSVGCSADALREACALIKQLDPKPGLRFSRDETRYVIPDVVVFKTRGKWVATANRAAMPRARLHGTYPAMFRSSRTDDRTPMAQELQEARWLIRNIEQRYATIQRVAEAIVERQQTFFEYGEVALRPLMLREIADELGIHESTVSRATGNKYMETPRGIYEFKHFFSRELATETGGTCSASAVRALIKEMIEGEDPKEPLSDVDLARLLGEQGVVVARRTVSKYRGQLKTPPAELRRAY